MNNIYNLILERNDTTFNGITWRGVVKCISSTIKLKNTIQTIRYY